MPYRCGCGGTTRLQRRLDARPANRPLASPRKLAIPDCLAPADPHVTVPTPATSPTPRRHQALSPLVFQARVPLLGAGLGRLTGSRWPIGGTVMPVTIARVPVTMRDQVMAGSNRRTMAVHRLSADEGGFDGMPREL